MSRRPHRRVDTDPVRLTNGTIDVVIATAVGPRVVALSLTGGENVFARLGDAGLDRPDGKRFTFYGGHRLWIAPEEPERTYEPDDEPVDIREIAGGAVATRRTGSGLAKSIGVTLGDESTVEVSHTIRNESAAPVELAPWAITQLRPGGTAVLPIGPGGDGSGVRPSSLIVGWPYTDFADDQVQFVDDMVLVDANRSTPTKIGTDLGRGWLAYMIDDLVFAKRARHRPGARYPDLGASAQVYCNHEFIELETLGPLVRLAPGEAARHSETWSVHRFERGVDPGAVAEFVERSL